ncbi:hypothetical protein BBJ28_00002420 [Nothophytophthora sp. Chile5]|nr:hypothetical protein BBJ28_00002420 [Nothophytophthora sp. Chile5]
MNVGDPGANDAAAGAALSAESVDGTSIAPSAGSGAPVPMQQQKRMLPVSDDERIAKLLKTETTASASGGATMAPSAQANAMAATRAMFGPAPSVGGAALPGTNHNLFFMGSQSMQPGHSMGMSQPMMGTNAAQQLQMQMQIQMQIQMQLQMQQRQQQYAAAMAGAWDPFPMCIRALMERDVAIANDFVLICFAIAQRNALTSPLTLQHQQQQSQAAFTANIVGQQSGGMAMNPQQIAQPVAQRGPQVRMSSGMNMHVASLMANQGAGFPGNTTSAVSAAHHPPSAAIIMQESQKPQQALGTTEKDHACLICKKQGDIFTCNGGCGLHVHPACIGEDALFPFMGMWMRPMKGIGGRVHTRANKNVVLWLGLLNSGAALWELLYHAAEPRVDRWPD